MNAIHARSQLRHSPTRSDVKRLKYRKKSYYIKNVVMLTLPSVISQESWVSRTLVPLFVLAERAVEDSPRSRA